MRIIKHKTFILIICCLFAITLASGIVYASSPKQQAAAVAEELFNQEGKGTCVEVWNTIGFESSEEANRAYLGDPTQVFVLENSVSVNKSLIDQEIATPIYLLPIYADGRCVTEMEVKLRDGDWVLGRIGGHKIAYLIELAHANKIEPSDFQLIRFGSFTVFATIKDGKEIGSTYQKDSKDFTMTEKNIIAFKEKIKSITDAVKGNSEDGTVIFDGQSNDMEYSFKQKDSTIERLGRYLRYILY